MKAVPPPQAASDNYDKEAYKAEFVARKQRLSTNKEETIMKFVSDKKLPKVKRVGGIYPENRVTLVCSKSIVDPLTSVLYTLVMEGYDVCWLNANNRATTLSSVIQKGVESVTDEKMIRAVLKGEVKIPSNLKAIVITNLEALELIMDTVREPGHYEHNQRTLANDLTALALSGLTVVVLGSAEEYIADDKIVFKQNPTLAAVAHEIVKFIHVTATPAKPRTKPKPEVREVQVCKGWGGAGPHTIQGWVS